MEFRVLGPLEVLGQRGPITLRGAERRGLVGFLVVHAGQYLRMDRIVDALWGESAPAGAARTVQTYVSQLRQVVDDARVRVVASEGGYTLEVPADAIDATRFERLLRDALSVVDPSERVGRLDEALALWRGPPLGEFGDTGWVATERARLEMLHRQALEQRVEARLALGEHRELTSELEMLVDEHPLDERLCAHLLLAYYRCGRQADALRAFERLRTTLSDELGTEPSSELRALENRVFNQDPALDLDVTQPPGFVSRSGASAGLPSGLVTFLLTDIEGSTRLWDRSAQTMADALVRHDAIIDEAVRAHDGLVLKTKGEGDSTFSVFPHATDAVAAAVEAQRALAAEPWPTGTALGVRMALTTGEAIERNGDYYGNTVNRVARLRALASRGEVLLAQSTAEVVRDHLPDGVTLTGVGTRRLKDLARPERVWRVEDEHAPTSPPGLMADAHGVRVPLPNTLLATASSALVGRSNERERLSRALERDGRHIVWVRGEPGIGKTHLVSKIGQDAHDDGATVLYGRCDEDLGAPYQPFVEALRHWTANVPIATLAAAAGHGLADLARLLPELAETPTRSDLAAGEAERYAVFEAVDGLISNIDTDAPLVLILDDLHWADQSSLLLLRHLARSPRTARLFIMATYRDTDLDRTHPLAATLADLRRDGTDERIDVGALDPSEVAVLVAGLGVDLGTDALSAVVAETEGNPFFVTEVTRHLAEVGPDATTVPEGVREVIGRRLSRLSSDVNDALAVAAVVGRDFDAAVVAATGGPTGETLHAALDEAVAAHVLDEVPGAFGHYRFAHALIRQTLVAELSANRRVRLHWAAGQALRQHDPAEVDAIARHLAQGVLAGDASTAADACLAAGDAASTAAAWDEAADHHQRAIDVLDQASTDDPDHRYRALMGVQRSAQALLDYRRARQAVLDAVAVARRNDWGERLTQAVVRGLEEYRPGSLDGVYAGLVDEALGSIGTADSIERSRLLSMRASGAVINPVATEADYEAWAVEAEAGFDMAERLGDPATRIHARRSLAFVLAVGPGGQRHLTAVKEMARILDDAFPTASDAGMWLAHSVAISLGGDGQVAGDPDTVADGIARLEELATRTDAPFVRAGLLWAQAGAALAAGRLDEAAELTEAIPTVTDDAGYRLVHWDLTTMRGFAVGDLDPGVEQMRSALAGGRDLFPELGFTLAAFLAASAADRQARGRLAEALEGGAPWTWGRRRALWGAAEAAARLTDAEAAGAIHLSLAPYDGTMLAPYGGWVIDGSAATSLGQLETVLGQYNAAEAHFRSGVELEERMGHTALAARSRLWWARMLLARGDAGDRATAQRLLDHAAATAERLGLGLLTRDIAEANTAVEVGEA